MTATETWRAAMGLNPRRKGLNGQTNPAPLRWFYVADAGRVFLGPDLAQAEARVVAYLANCESQIHLFNDPKRNFHKENAAKIFSMDVGDVVKGTPIYDAAKQSGHASNYMESPLMMAMTTGLPLKLCAKAIKGYYDLYPEIPAWHRETFRRVKTTGKLVNPWGMERSFTRAMSKALFIGEIGREEQKEMVAFVPQSTVPVVTNRGLMGLLDKLDYARAHHQGHDSYLVSVPVGRLTEAVEVAIEELTVPIPINGRQLVIPCEMAVGFSFGALMPWTGSEPSRGEWERWVEAEGKNDPRKAVEFCYGLFN